MRRTIINKFFAVSCFHHFVKVNLHFFTQCSVYMHNNCFLAANASKENSIFMALFGSNLRASEWVFFRNHLTVGNLPSTNQVLHCDAVVVCKRAVCLCKDIFPRQSISANLADSCFSFFRQKINEKLWSDASWQKWGLINFSVHGDTSFVYSLLLFTRGKCC